ncbi:MAG: YfhO family protein, partial [Actinomycetota bacterium]
VLAVELVANGLMGHRALPFEPAPALLVQLPEPTLRMSSYLRPDAVARALQRLPAGRSIVQDLPGGRRQLADPRSTIFRIEQAQGYNPVQLKRYWFFVRALTPVVLDHNLSIFYRPSPVLRDLLQVRYVVAPVWPFSTPFGGPLAVQGPARLFEAGGAAPRASVVGSWTVVPGFDASLREVTRVEFDPQTGVILEEDPGLPRERSPQDPGRAEYTFLGTQSGRVSVQASGPALVLIRTPYARGWHATVNGRPAKVLAADFVVQAVPVQAGRHTILLTYDDPSIGYGLVASGLAFAALIGSILMAARRDRRRTTQVVQRIR